MSDAFLGEIRLFAIGFTPVAWSACEGQALNIQQNAALFALLGTYYGGDGKTTFNLPDLRGRTIVGYGATTPDRLPGTVIGAKAGSEQVTLTAAQMPPHNHALLVDTSNAASTALANAIPSTVIKPTNAAATAPAAPAIYGATGALVGLNPAIVASTGGGGGHENRQPYIALRYCICTQGLFPPRN